MNRVVLVFVFLSLLMGSLHCQVQEISTVLNDGEVDKTIVRVYNNDYSICYVQNPQRNYFCLFCHTAPNQPVRDVEFNRNLCVNDFVIRNDTVFFCGDNTPTASGFVGFFSIASFFSNGGGTYYTLDHKTVDPLDYAKTLNAMTVCSASGTTGDAHVLCVGMSNDNVSCLLDVYRFATPQCTWSFLFREAPSSDEEWLDVVSTKDYVVVSGYYNTGTNRVICMRQLERSMLTSLTLFNNLAVFGSNSYQWYYPELLTASVAGANKFFSVAYYDQGTSFGGIQVAEYDASVMAAGLSTAMTSFFQWNVGQSLSGQKLRDMAYCRQTDALLLLSDAIDFPAGAIRNTVFEVPVIATSAIAGYYTANVTLHSLDLLSTKDYYVATGADTTVFLTYERKRTLSTSNCGSTFVNTASQLGVIANYFMPLPVSKKAGIYCFEQHLAPNLQVFKTLLYCSD